MATSSPSPKFSNGWIPYLTLVFFIVFVISQVIISNFTEKAKVSIQDSIGLIFLLLFLYFLKRSYK